MDKVSDKMSEENKGKLLLLDIKYGYSPTNGWYFHKTIDEPLLLCWFDHRADVWRPRYFKTLTDDTAEAVIRWLSQKEYWRR